jgi:hypothetical protein
MRASGFFHSLGADLKAVANSWRMHFEDISSLPNLCYRGEAAFTAVERAILTHGGVGYAKDFHLERYASYSPSFELTLIPATVPRNHVAETDARVLPCVTLHLLRYR